MSYQYYSITQAASSHCKVCEKTHVIIFQCISFHSHVIESGKNRANNGIIFFIFDSLQVHNFGFECQNFRWKQMYCWVIIGAKQKHDPEWTRKGWSEDDGNAKDLKVSWIKN